MSEMTPIRKTLVASMHAVGQQTKMVAAETVTDTRWEKGTLGEDQFVATAQQTKMANFDTRTRTAWESGTVTVAGRPTFAFSQDVDATVAYGEALQGLEVRLDGAKKVASQTRVVKAETLTDTHWEVGEDGDVKKAQATNQVTRVDNFDTVTRARWTLDAAWTGPAVQIAPAPRPQPAPRPLPAPALPTSGAIRPVVFPPVVIKPPVICPPAPVVVVAPPAPVVAPPAPVEPAKPTIDAKAERLRRDLDLYLAGPENKDSDAVLHVLRTAPQYAEAATAEQKARLIKQVVAGSANADERGAALKVLQLAEAKGELVAVMKELSDKRALADVLHDLGDEREGKAAAKQWMKAGLYAESWFYEAMDDDAASGLVESLGFTEPMIGTSDELSALPEAAKHHMIRELLAGNLTWGELAQAEWLNQHTTIPYRIPDYRNR